MRACTAITAALAAVAADATTVFATLPVALAKDQKAEAKSQEPVLDLELRCVSRRM